MTQERRQAILAAFEERASDFREIARRRSTPLPPLTGPSPVRPLRPCPPLPQAPGGRRGLAEQQFVVCGDGRGEGLSPRQLQVLVLIARGASNEQAAQCLGISAETVKTHVKHALDALGAVSRAEAVATAFCRGLLRPSGPTAGD